MQMNIFILPPCFPHTHKTQSISFYSLECIFSPLKYSIFLYITAKKWLDVIECFVGNVGRHHILDLHGYLGIGLDDTVALDLDRPDWVSDGLLSS